MKPPRVVARTLRRFEPPTGAAVTLTDRVRKLQRAARFVARLAPPEYRNDRRWSEQTPLPRSFV